MQTESLDIKHQPSTCTAILEPASPSPAPLQLSIEPQNTTPNRLKNVQNKLFDILVDKLIGNNEPIDNQYALICTNCFTHNGLVLSDEIRNASKNTFSI